ncbi:MAG: deoxynucleoside kinase [Clostridia bacterium]|nr:deoxynucleoside kinase [Clostridia bacterium]
MRENPNLWERQMKHEKMILVEGVSNAGKTALCKGLSETYGFVVIPEGIRYLEKQTGKFEAELMSIPTTLEIECNNQKTLFDMELQRIIDANRLLSKSTSVVIDKSALSIMSTALAFEKIKGLKGAFDHVNVLYSKYREDILQQSLREPNGIVLLSVSHDSARARNAKRSHVLEADWISEKIQTIQDGFLKNWISNMQIPSIIIDTSPKSLLEVLDEVARFIFNLE